MIPFRVWRLACARVVPRSVGRKTRRAEGIVCLRSLPAPVLSRGVAFVLAQDREILQKAIFFVRPAIANRAHGAARNRREYAIEFPRPRRAEFLALPVVGPHHAEPQTPNAERS
jgi:hypothetical protein